MMMIPKLNVVTHEVPNNARQRASRSAQLFHGHQLKVVPPTMGDVGPQGGGNET